jgi:transposase
LARKRLSMRKTSQVLRLKWEGCLSNRAIARACKIGRATVRDYLNRAEKAGLSWTQVEQMNEADLWKMPFSPRSLFSIALIYD